MLAVMFFWHVPIIFWVIPCFLAQKGISSSSCTFPAPALKSVLPAKNPGFFSCITVFRSQDFRGHFSQTFLVDDVKKHIYTYIHVFIHIISTFLYTEKIRNSQQYFQFKNFPFSYFSSLFWQWKTWAGGLKYPVTVLSQTLSRLPHSVWVLGCVLVTAPPLCTDTPALCALLCPCPPHVSGSKFTSDHQSFLHGSAPPNTFLSELFRKEREEELRWISNVKSRYLQLQILCGKDCINY